MNYRAARSCASLCFASISLAALDFNMRHDWLVDCPDLGNHPSATGAVRPTSKRATFPSAGRSTIPSAGRATIHSLLEAELQPWLLQVGKRCSASISAPSTQLGGNLICDQVAQAGNPFNLACRRPLNYQFLLNFNRKMVAAFKTALAGAKLQTALPQGRRAGRASSTRVVAMVSNKKVIKSIVPTLSSI